jgi:hypothetical protein
LDWMATSKLILNEHIQVNIGRPLPY